MTKAKTTYLCHSCHDWFTLENFDLELGVCLDCGAEENKED